MSLMCYQTWYSVKCGIFRAWNLYLEKRNSWVKLNGSLIIKRLSQILYTLQSTSSERSQTINGFN